MVDNPVYVAVEAPVLASEYAYPDSRSVEGVLPCLFYLTVTAGRQVHDRRNSGVYEAHRVYKRSCMARIPSTTGDGLEIRVTTGLL